MFHGEAHDMPWVPKCRYRDAAIRAEKRLAGHPAGCHLVSCTEPQPNDSRVSGRIGFTCRIGQLKSTSSRVTEN